VEASDDGSHPLVFAQLDLGTARFKNEHATRLDR
jgi:hypothetical protein